VAIEKFADSGNLESAEKAGGKEGGKEERKKKK